MRRLQRPQKLGTTKPVSARSHCFELVLPGELVCTISRLIASEGCLFWQWSEPGRLKRKEMAISDILPSEVAVEKEMAEQSAKKTTAQTPLRCFHSVHGSLRNGL